MLEQPNLHYLEKFCPGKYNRSGCLIASAWIEFLESLLLVILKHLIESSEKKVYAIRFSGFYVLRSLEEFMEITKMIKSIELLEQSDE